MSTNFKENNINFPNTGIGMVLKFVGVLQAKKMKFQLSFSMDLVLVENIGETI